MAQLEMTTKDWKGNISNRNIQLLTGIAALFLIAENGRGMPLVLLYLLL